ncbi:MAG: hypothetical protein KJ970_20140 [Candidatus Eisenbacteria bacterium]|uniref:Zinc-finger domain-containing protein n=1 Tax=Eiseniibacteriota bacterium TaxID=2212470 RepID=A0A948W829_UNCEI|nr:hypothetical protein [Candidatus Eisenbacteria bacterium]MBU1950568.1 hypothetical protein [Candidatus Eisenbacteria bacterium]MBU2693234.1 hypothetical protein [Candidatus Eisenbacteria bacterium]
MKERIQCIDPEKGVFIAAYELGLLDDSEAMLFESHLTDCPYCLEALYEGSSISRVMTDKAHQIGALLETAGAGMAPEKRDKNPAKTVTDWWRSAVSRLNKWGDMTRQPKVWAPLGALAAAAVVFAVLLSSDETARISGLAQIEPVPYTQLQTRGEGATDAAERFSRGMTYYAAGRYEEAAAELAASVAAGERDGHWKNPDQTRFYLGLSLLLENRPEEARPYLKGTAASIIRPIAERSKWYSAQIELLLGNPEMAVEYLEFLADSSIGYSKKANEQLNTLREAGW